MAPTFSSLASSFQSQKKHDVFISFRGGDTRFTFTSHLHNALCRSKVETFIDDRLEKGGELWPKLEEAIEGSTLFLVILSEDYASSTWCLKELTKILQSTCRDQGKGQRVMPVFYKIEPSHVRKQLGKYEEAFAKYDHMYSGKKQPAVNKWRESLTQVANFAGWQCTSNRNEAELVDEIVRAVIQRLDCMHQGEGDSKNLVGIHRKIADVESLLHNGSSKDVRFVGIQGRRGIGKTALAKEVFNKLYVSYEGFCFLANIKEESKKHGIAALRKKLMLTLLGDKDSHVGMPDGITPFAMKRLGRKKSLVVLDDIDDQEQLENLAGRHDWFGSGSKILITARNKQVLGKEVDDIYVLEGLNSGEALCLFSLHAFKNDFADMELKELAKNVVCHAKGIPRVLKALGCFLYGKSKKEWKRLLAKLKKMLCTKLYDVLKFSSQGLDHEEKNIFLDIAPFFKGRGMKNKKIRVNKARAIMQNLIQEIVGEETWKDSIKKGDLWTPREVSQILMEDMGPEAIECLALNVPKVEETHLGHQAFGPIMPKVEFLDFSSQTNLIEQVNKFHLTCGLGQLLPHKVVLLPWDGYPLKSLRGTFSVEVLVTIEMSNSNLIKFDTRNLWTPREVSQILMEDMGPEAIECLALNVPKVEEMHLSHQAFGPIMPKVEYLDFSGQTNLIEQVSMFHLTWGHDQLLPHKVVRLPWDGYPLKSLRGTFSVEGLVTIKMSNSNLIKFVKMNTRVLLIYARLTSTT
ncbi:disease resistance protein RPV1-like [Prosopis cineraria]|uniref:disease resistance protein RPV1-like n=1 Tax=Prosopis cineraria TaxID=364024 RepID=UPI00240F365F|nr:disease resistance protein RPV1-like [Prosopis cineraria]